MQQNQRLMRAFTLIEVMLALLILSFVMLSLVKLHYFALQHAQKNFQQLVEEENAENESEKLAGV